MHKIRIGSRGSDLALWQAEFVKGELRALGIASEITIITTQGDAIQHLSFDKMEGKGFFTKEIETALLKNEIDLAVHSHKDLETEQPEGLLVAAVSDREDPADILLVAKNKYMQDQLWGLSENAVIGTSSARRKAQLRRYLPAAELKDLRGNVPTRINKLRQGEYDAIMLAKAGVDRLEIDLSDLHVVVMDPSEFVPAPAQGVLAFQIRASDKKLFDILQNLNNSSVARRITVERKVLNLLEGGCQLPLGVYCESEEKVHVAYSTNWENGASLFTYETDDLNALPEIIVEDLLKTTQ
jgi:hydroxymethylbilane synthase